MVTIKTIVTALPLFTTKNHNYGTSKKKSAFIFFIKRVSSMQNNAFVLIYTEKIINSGYISYSPLLFRKGRTRQVLDSLWSMYR